MSITELKPLSREKCFGGWIEMVQHTSEVCQSPMNLTVFRPPQAEDRPVPILYYLSGLTCTHENFIIKAGAQQYAAEHGLLLVAPDTSPRNTGISGEDEAFDLGSGAGFYVNATTDKWKRHYQMYSYITEELPQVIHQNFPVQSDRESIFGHSMGGHGALMIALRNPQRFRSLSALSPISAVSQSQLSRKALVEYLGEDPSVWDTYDATHLMEKNSELKLPILIDQGQNDEFYDDLRVEGFDEVCRHKNYPLTLRIHPDYGHGYYFVATFMKDHIDYHAKALKS